MSPDLKYLSTIGGAFPSRTCFWGVAFDGQRLGMIGYGLRRAEKMIQIRPGAWDYEYPPVIFYAGRFEGCSMSMAVRIFDQISEAMGGGGLSLCLRGALGWRDLFVQHLRSQNGRHEVELFSQGQGRLFEPVEVITAVCDDKVEGVIRLADEFKSRPERVMLDEEIRVIDPESRFTMVQEAFLYGLGAWSCKVKRSKSGGVWAGCRVY